ncbi:MAG: DUF6171 family protein [Ruminococcus sp.]|nr:DUF6171 family protein [Ruminococcus sp.]
MNKVKCRRCLLEDMDQNEFFKTLSEYISHYPEEKRVQSSVYKARLDICKACNELINGMCRKCGCYVELRALKKNKNCPDVPKRW